MQRRPRNSGCRSAPSSSGWLDYRRHGEAGLAPRKTLPRTAPGRRWTSGGWRLPREVMAEYTDQSRPSQTLVIDQTRARVTARFGSEVVQQPSRAAAFRVLGQLEEHPLFRLSTKRNRDIADRPKGALREAAADAAGRVPADGHRRGWMYSRSIR